MATTTQEPMSREDREEFLKENWQEFFYPQGLPDDFKGFENRDDEGYYLDCPKSPEHEDHYGMIDICCCEMYGCNTDCPCLCVINCGHGMFSRAGYLQVRPLWRKVGAD